MTPDLRAEAPGAPGAPSNWIGREAAWAHLVLLRAAPKPNGAMRFVLDKLGLDDPAALVLLDVGVMRVESWTGHDGATAWQPWDGDRIDGSAAIVVPVYGPIVAPLAARSGSGSQARAPQRGAGDIIDLVALDPYDESRFVRRTGAAAMIGADAVWSWHVAAVEAPPPPLRLYATPMAWLRGAAAALADWRTRRRDMMRSIGGVPTITPDLHAHGLCVLDEAVNLERLLAGIGAVATGTDAEACWLRDRLQRERRARRDREPPLPMVVVPAPEAAANPGIAAGTADRAASNTWS